MIDLAGLNSPVPSLSSFDGNGPLSVFNFLDLTDYNLWYTMVKGNDIFLVSNFIYKITTDANAVTVASSPAFALSSLGLSLNAATASATGDKLCYASSSTGNVPSDRFSSRPNCGRTWLCGSSG